MLEGRNAITAVLVAAAAAIGIGTAAGRSDSGEITSAGAVDAFDMRVGDCFDDTAFGVTDVSELPGVPCSDPHDNEVYALWNIQGEWPGEDNVEELAYRGCYDRFPNAIGKSYEDSVIDYSVIYPSQESWNQRGDREVICVAFHMELEKLTGSVIGSGL